ncbi:MAG: DUF1549 domain-containing protein, partial [Planctomycetota bacterium]|nr:DUF1549 domain-containing protein [Planctomycetota bacterium]
MNTDTMVRMDVRQRIVRGRWARWLGTILVMLVSRGYTASAVDYTRDIKPVFKARCYACHGSIKQEAGLRVDTAAAIHKGGDSGAAVRPRKPMESLLLQRVLSRDKTERMPADGDPLTERQIEMLRAWIAKGAPQPQGEVGQADPKTHWAFRPIESAKLRVTNSDNAIDFYVDRALNKVGLSRNPPADARTLVHRMFFDMHGLPPDPRQIDIWTDRIATDDGRLDAKGIEQLVDHLLGSSRYGERWAQHWLDVVRYADTHGFEVNTPRPNAWPYRDYVIRALNDDKPYDQFVMDQIVGDARAEGAATGFLVAAPVLLPGQIGKDEASKRQARQDSLDEIVVGTSATFLGLTVG